MAPLVRIAGHLRAVLAAHVALELMDRRRLRTPHDVQGDRLVGIAAEAPDFKIKVARVERVTQVGEGCAGPLKASIRLVQASQASLSASWRALAARWAATPIIPKLIKRS
jgi:hypothetical protein